MRLTNTERRPLSWWLRRAFWYGFSFVLAIALVLAFVLVPAFLTGCVFGALEGLVPSFNLVKAKWPILVSLAVSGGLIFVFIRMDNRKWHFAEKLRRLRENENS